MRATCRQNSRTGNRGRSRAEQVPLPYADRGSAYAANTREAHRSRWAKWQEYVTAHPEIPYRPGRPTLKLSTHVFNFAQHLSDTGVTNGAKDYISTVLDLLVEEGSLEQDAYAFHRLPKLQKSMNMLIEKCDPLKAQIWPLGRVAILSGRAGRLLRCWIATGLRMHSFLSLEDEFVAPSQGEPGWLNIVVPLIKSNPQAGPRFVCTVPEEVVCPGMFRGVTAAWIRAHILEPLQTTGHGPRRYAAIYLRTQCSRRGWQSVEAVPKGIRRRIADLMGWSRKSREFAKYSADFALYLNTGFVFPRALHRRIFGDELFFTEHLAAPGGQVTRPRRASSVSRIDELL
mmetsp:Transcript_23456/g.59333  ORF Transcript_23456/g.59333 Transcript_23456/m.59333 type:complete len:343 (+) Transcript_23456:74-1102(+)